MTILVAFFVIGLVGALTITSTTTKAKSKRKFSALSRPFPTVANITHLKKEMLSCASACYKTTLEK